MTDYEKLKDLLESFNISFDEIPTIYKQKCKAISLDIYSSENGAAIEFVFDLEGNFVELELCD